MRWRGSNPLAEQAPPTTLREELDHRRALMQQYVPAETQIINLDTVEELRASGIAKLILAAGEQAPAFELPGHNGVVARSADLLARGPLVVIFFRGRWCPFCCAHLEAMNAVAPQVTAAGASLVAISGQTLHQTSLLHDQHKLAFPLLSDAGLEVARRFRLVYRVPQQQQQLYRKTFVNLPFLNGSDSWELPLPATYVIGPDGRVRYARADEDYTLRPEPAEVLAALTI